MATVAIVPRIKTLTKGTSANLAHTCFGLVDFANFLLSLYHNYVRSENFALTQLEKDFNKLVATFESSYFLSVKKILEKNENRETKLLHKLNVEF